jgi:hypothetical protein
MPELNEDTLNLLRSMDDLCGFMIEETGDNAIEANQLRVCEINNVRTIVRALLDEGPLYTLEEFKETLDSVSQRVKDLHRNPKSVGKHAHQLEKEGKV